MPTYNFKEKELTAKIVYYGPGMCGKTTNLQEVHKKMRANVRGKLVSIATESERTIYFDLLPVNLGKLNGMNFNVRVYTVPGQIFYAETRRIVLQGADGVVFVADSGKDKLKENLESLQDLKKNLAANKLDYDTIPMVFQWNKRDLPGALPVATLNQQLNERGLKGVEAIAPKGDGVLETLRAITMEVFNHVKRGGKAAPGGKASFAAAAARATPTEASAVENPDDMKQQIAFAEFQNLAVMHHKMVEKVAALEKDMFQVKKVLRRMMAERSK